MTDLSATNEVIGSAQKVLQEVWGYPGFRDGQREAIQALCQQKDVLLLMPTGGGKSLCYQVPAMAQEGFGLVISPLVSLMQDQVESLQKLNVSAAFINSTLSYREIEQRWVNAEYGLYDLVYIAPERLDSEFLTSRSSRLNINLLAVDEAHCVSEWGHHFRPAYLQIKQAREMLGNPPCIAATATATPEVRRDIVEQLGLTDVEEVVRGFDRPNLIWSVFRDVNKKRKVREIVHKVAGSGLVYVATRKSATRWAAWLDKHDVSAAAYHGGMKSDAREAIQQKWIDGEMRIVVATNAFGMGIDKEDVRFVIHAELPASVEAYYQEAGRGGRDGKRAHAVLLYHAPDAETQQYLIDSGHPNKNEIRKVYEGVCNLGQISVHDKPEDPARVDLPKVCSLTGLAHPKVRNAIDLLERQGFWEVMPQRSKVGHIKFSQSATDVRAYADRHQNSALAGFLTDLLRAVHADAYRTWWPLHVPRIARKMNIREDKLNRGLEYLADRGIVDWMGPGRVMRLMFLEPRTPKPRIDDRTVQQARKQAEKRLKYLTQYAESDTCRRKFLLNYFGESCDARCGHCDICLGRHTPKEITPDDKPDLLAVLRAAMSEPERQKWSLHMANYRLDALIDWLANEGYLRTRPAINASYEVTERGEALLQRLDDS